MLHALSANLQVTIEFSLALMCLQETCGSKLFASMCLGSLSQLTSKVVSLTNLSGSLFALHINLYYSATVIVILPELLRGYSLRGISRTSEKKAALTDLFPASVRCSVSTNSDLKKAIGWR